MTIIKTLRLQPTHHHHHHQPDHAMITRFVSIEEKTSSFDLCFYTEKGEIEEVWEFPTKKKADSALEYWRGRGLVWLRGLRPNKAKK